MTLCSNGFLCLLLVILSVFGIFLMALAGRDAAPLLYLALRRRSKRENSDNAVYMACVRDKGLIMLRDAPLLRLSDNKRLLLLEDIFLRHERRESLRYTWSNGLLAKGILQVGFKADPEKVNRVLEQYSSFFVENGKLKQSPEEVDGIINAEVLILWDKLSGRSQFREVVDVYAGYLKKRFEQEGLALAYRRAWGPTGIRLVDTLGMTTPFLTLYGLEYGDNKTVSLAHGAIMEYITLGLDERSGLVRHGYNPTLGNLPVGLVGWGRGTGWFLMGLKDTISYLHSYKVYDGQYDALVRSQANLMTRLQRKDGGWGAMLTVASSNYDSSATAMIAGFLAGCMRMGLLPQEHMNVVERAVASLQRLTWPDGTVDRCQGDLIDFNKHSFAFGPHAAAQGTVLSLMNELRVGVA